MAYTFIVLSLIVAGVHCLDQKFAVVAYLPEWRYGGANFEKMCSTVTHMIFFSIEPSPSGDIVGLDRFPRADVLDDARNKGCQLIICFGGNGRSCMNLFLFCFYLTLVSAGFSPMTRNKESRTKFVKKVRKLILKNQLDGVDYNWYELQFRIVVPFTICMCV